MDSYDITPMARGAPKEANFQVIRNMGRLWDDLIDFDAVQRPSSRKYVRNRTYTQSMMSSPG